MKHKQKKNIEFHLILNEEEARILKGIIQNTSYETLDDEPDKSIALREELFDALTEKS